jgi:hypothetical protein
MAVTGSQIVLVNRIGEDLKFVCDGQHHVLTPGENYGYVDSQGYFAKSQNPLMGSEDYYTLDFQSLVGVKGKDDCTPLSDDVLLAAMDCVERFDREGSGLRPGVRTKPRHRMPRGRTGEVSGGAGDNSFAIGGN